MSSPAKWPKTFPPITEEQVRISDDFMKHWLEVLPQRFGMIETFNHGYVVRTAPTGFQRTLEIGAGVGSHIFYEELSKEQLSGYHAVDIRANIVQKLKRNHPEIQAILGDCQEHLDFPDGYFDRILAIHVLEHLPNLPAALKEIYRLCDKERGVAQIVIPCEGSLAYGIARRISAQRIFEKRYNQPYKWWIEREHINMADEVLHEVSRYFRIEKKSFFPLPLPAFWCNLVIGFNARPLATPRS